MTGVHAEERGAEMRECPACGSSADLSRRDCPTCGASLPDLDDARTWGHVQYLLGETVSWEQAETVPTIACRWIRTEYGARAEALARAVRAGDYLARARRLSQHGHPEEAAERCRQALALAPDRVDGWELLGTLCASRERWEETLEAVEQGLTLAPEHPRMLFLRDRARDRLRATAEVARERPVSATLPLLTEAPAPPTPDPVSAAVAAGPSAPKEPWWQPLAAFLEERNIKYWHGVGILVLLGGLLGLVQWQWDLLGRWVILGMLFSLTAGSYTLGRRLGPEYQVSRMVLLALAGLLLPLDLATAHEFLPVFRGLSANAARLGIALLCLPIYARAAWRLREPLFVAFASAASAGAGHYVLQLLLPGARGVLAGSTGQGLLPELYRHDGLLLLPLAAAHIVLACRLAREGVRELARPLLLAGQVLAGLGIAAALVGAPAAGGVAGLAVARDGGLPTVLLLGVLFYAVSAYLVDDSRYLRAAAAALALLAVAGPYTAGATPPPWHTYLPFLTVAAALLVIGGVTDEAARGGQGPRDGTTFATEYQRGAHALLALLLGTMVVRWLIALAARHTPGDPGELVTLAVVAAAGAALYTWLAILQGTPGLLYLAGSALGASVLALVLRLDPTAGRVSLGPAFALAAGACAVGEAVLRRRGHVAFAAPLADVGLVLRLVAAGWVGYRYAAAVVLGLPVPVPRLAALVTLVMLSAPSTTLAFSERRPRALYGAITYGAAAYLLGIAALWDGPAARLVPWNERNYGLMLVPLAAALAAAAHWARRQPEFARPAYHLAAVAALGIIGYQAAWMALPRPVVLLLLLAIAGAITRLLWQIGAPWGRLTSPPAPPRSGEGSSGGAVEDGSGMPPSPRPLGARFGWLLVPMLLVPLALDAAGVLARLPFQPAMGPTVWLGLAGATLLCLWLTQAGDRAAYGTPVFGAVLPYGATLAAYGVLWQSFALTAPLGMVSGWVAVARGVMGAAAACAAAVAAEWLRRRGASRWRAPLAWSACAAALASSGEAIQNPATHLAMMAALLLALGSFAAASVALQKRWVAAGGLTLFLFGFVLVAVVSAFRSMSPDWVRWSGVLHVMTLLAAAGVMAWVALRFRSAWFAGSASLLLVVAILYWTAMVAERWTAAACLAVLGLLVAGLMQVAALLHRIGYADVAPGPARVADGLAFAVGWGLLAQLEEKSLGPAAALAGAAVAAAYAGEARRRNRAWLLYPAMIFAAGGWAGVVMAWLLPASRSWGWEPNGGLWFLPFGVALAFPSLQSVGDRRTRPTAGEAGARPLRQGAVVVLSLVALAQLDALARGWWATAAIAWAGVGAAAAVAARVAAAAQSAGEAQGGVEARRDWTAIHALVAVAGACALGAAYAGGRWLGLAPVWGPLAMLAPVYAFDALVRRVRARSGYPWDLSLAVVTAAGAALVASVTAANGTDAALPGDARALTLAIAGVAASHLLTAVAERRRWFGLHAGAACLLGIGYLAAVVGRLPEGAPVLASFPWLWAAPALLGAVMIGHRAWLEEASDPAAGSRLLLACGVATGGTLAALWHAGVPQAGVGLGLAGVSGIWALVAAARREGSRPAQGPQATPFTAAAAVCAGLSALLALLGLSEANTSRLTVAALILSAGTYAGLAVLHRARAYAHLAFACAMTAYALWLYDRSGISGENLDFYLIPIGLYILLFATWLRRFQVTRGEEALPLEAMGLLLALAPTLLASFRDTGAGHSWLLLTECLLAIFWGVAQRIRVYAGLGMLFLVALLAQHVYQPLTHVHWAIYATVLGLGIIASALGFERRRAEVLDWAARVTAELRTWD